MINFAPAFLHPSKGALIFMNLDKDEKKNIQ